MNIGFAKIKSVFCLFLSLSKVVVAPGLDTSVPGKKAPTVETVIVCKPPYSQVTSFDCVCTCWTNFLALTSTDNTFPSRNANQNLFQEYLKFKGCKIPSDNPEIIEQKLVFDHKLIELVSRPADFYRKYFDVGSSWIKEPSLPMTKLCQEAFFKNRENVYYYLNKEVLKSYPDHYKCVAKKVLDSKKFYLFYFDDFFQSKENKSCHCVLLVLERNYQNNIVISLFDPEFGNYLGSRDFERFFCQERLDLIVKVVQKFLDLAL